MTARGPLHEHILVRLADEGVPIAALVRSFKHPREHVVRVLEEAVERGMLLGLPSSDWPPGALRTERTPCMRKERLDDENVLILRLMHRFEIPANPALLLAAMLSRPEATRTYLSHAVWGDQIDQPDPKIIDVMVCKLRKTLKPWGVEIQTIWGKGYRLPKASVERVRELCGAEG